MEEFTAKEVEYLQHIHTNITKLRDFLNNNALDETQDLNSWFNFLGTIRSIQGNTSNDFSFLACLLAKRYLVTRFNISDFDAGAKPQGAPGLDIDLITADGRRVIAEIKTTVPYSNAKNDLGAAQKVSFQNDFDKLNAAQSDYKFFFVTDMNTYQVVQQRYIHKIPNVELVLLTNT